MSKVPAADEEVTITYKMSELEAVMKSLQFRKCALTSKGDNISRSVRNTLAALTKTRTAIDQTIHHRKNRDQ